MTLTSPPPASTAGVVWSVGEVATALGVPASTLRTWERRYGLQPSVRTSGGHRRYDAADIERIRLMNHLVRQGVTPAEAAQAASRIHLTHDTTRRDEAWVDEVILSARQYDSRALVSRFNDVLQRHGMMTAWTDYLAPTLRRVGEEWASGGLGVDSEHLVSETLLTVMRARLHEIGVHPTDATVLLASAEDDQHALPIVAIQVALAEAGVPAHALGPRLPSGALADIAARTNAATVFIWASVQRSTHDRLHRVLGSLAGSTSLLLGGPGWEGAHVPGSTVCHDLPMTVAEILGRLR
ncbi:MAG: MerR family transcriptional regulator [Aeromicrobium erythreum]